MSEAACARDEAIPEDDVARDGDDAIDAVDLVVGEIITDDENYDEVILLDLSEAELLESWQS